MEVRQYHFAQYQSPNQVRPIDSFAQWANLNWVGGNMPQRVRRKQALWGWLGLVALQPSLSVLGSELGFF